VADERPFQRSSQRYDVRIPIDFRAVESETAWTSGITANISLAGAFIEAVDQVAFGTRVELKFQVPTQKETIVVGAEVRWSAGNGFGVQFEGLRARDVWALGKYFEQQTEE